MHGNAKKMIVTFTSNDWFFKRVYSKSFFKIINIFQLWMGMVFTSQYKHLNK